MKYLKKIILEELYKILKEDDKDVARNMGARVRGEGEIADDASDTAYRAIGVAVNYMITKPDKASFANQAITELKQFMKDHQVKLGQFAQSAYGIVEKSKEEVKEYYFNISKQFEEGGVKAAQAYIQQYSGNEQPPTQSNQAKPTTTKEIPDNELGSKTNPVSTPEQIRQLKNKYPAGTMYYFAMPGQKPVGRPL